MRQITTMFFCLTFLGVSWSHKVAAQEAPKAAETPKAPEGPAHYYRLEFVVQELGADGKPANSRTYSNTASTDRSDLNASIRTGSRVPVATGGANGAPSNFQYMDVGVNIDARNTHEVNGKLAISLVAEVSSLATPTGLSQPSTPVVRNNRWQAPVLLPLNKPTVVFTSDALDTKGNMQLVVTATPMQ
jgi:hypothetical protein